MADRPDITRRDFLNGFALSLAAGSSLSPLEILAREAQGGHYPPSLTGLRGSQPGSFEAAHALAWSGVRVERPAVRTDDVYDLVVVGGGISGLAAAHLYRQRAGADRRVLVIDNHDDFGGHARRNEFEVDGRTLIGYGGSQSIDTPGAFSCVSAGMLETLGIDVQRFYEYFDRGFFARRDLRPAIHFTAERYGRDVTLPNVFGDFRGEPDPAVIDAAISAYPVSAASRTAIASLLRGDRDYLDGYSNAEKLALLRSMPFTDYLRRHAGMTDEVVGILRDIVKGYWGVGWDALAALEAWKLGVPGVRHLELEPDAFLEPDKRNEPYIFHFPDGNATIARALVRDLVPDCVEASTIESLVTARLDYGQLDRPSSRCRIRLNATAVDARHTADERHVDVTYVRDGRPETIRARHAVLACYNAMIPHLCPELPAAQADAIRHAVKIPLVYISVAVRNWSAWQALGTHSIYVPQSPHMHSFGLDFPVSIGDYAFTDAPDQPTVIHGTYVPTEPGKGLNDKQQSRAGRRRLYEMSYDEHESQILGLMSAALGPGGFDAGRDVAAITVNRWPHGYAYEYNHLFEPLDFGPGNGPHVTGRARIGRISIANSDAAARAYVDGAIDAADRAVDEQLAVSDAGL